MTGKSIEEVNKENELIAKESIGNRKIVLSIDQELIVSAQSIHREQNRLIDLIAYQYRPMSMHSFSLRLFIKVI